MTHLNTRVRTGLEEDGDGDVFAHIDWTVQEDPALDAVSFESDDAIYEELRKRYAVYAEQHPEDVNFSAPRSLAFIAITQDHVDGILEDPGPEKYNWEEGFLDLVAVHPEDGVQPVTLSLVFPSVYSLINGIGFHHIRTGSEDIFAE